MGFLNRRVSKAWVLAALLGSGLSVPAIAQSLNELACAAAVFCAPKITAEDAQVVFNLTEAQAQTAFIEASKDWPDHAWRCAAGGRTCGALSQTDAQILIGLPEQAYGPAEQLRANGPVAEKTQETVQPKKPTAPAAPSRPPPIVVEKLPPPGPGSFREVPIPQGTSLGEIQPLDGQWTMVFGTTQTAGCLPGIAENVGKGLPGAQSGPKVFDKPFQASSLMKNPSIKWRRVAPNHHQAQLTPSSSAMAMGYDWQVLSATQMQGKSLVTVRIPGQPVCTVTTPFTYQRQGS